MFMVCGVWCVYGVCVSVHGGRLTEGSREREGGLGRSDMGYRSL